MLTERKMFSSSLESSATSGVETRHDLVADLARRPPRRARAGGVRPPTTFGVVRDRVVGAARVDALGREGEGEVLAGRRPDSSSSGSRCSRVVPGIGGRLEHDELACAEDAGDRLGRAPSSGPRSGSRSASAASGRRSGSRRSSRSIAGSVEAEKRSPRPARSAEGTSSMSLSARESLPTRASSVSKPTTS